MQCVALALFLFPEFVLRRLARLAPSARLFLMTTTNTNTTTTSALTARDAYEMGRYVTRHMGTQGALDRVEAFSAWIDSFPLGTCLVDAPVWLAFWLGRDRFARTGTH